LKRGAILRVIVAGTLQDGVAMC